MLIRSTLLALTLFPAVAMAESQAPAQDKVDAFVAAVEANGCKINGETAPAIMAASGLDGATAEAIMNFLGEAGEDPAAAIKLARGDDGTITMTSKGCPAG